MYCGWYVFLSEAGLDLTAAAAGRRRGGGTAGLISSLTAAPTSGLEKETFFSSERTCFRQERARFS